MKGQGTSRRFVARARSERAAYQNRKADLVRIIRTHAHMHACTHVFFARLITEVIDFNANTIATSSFPGCDNIQWRIIATVIKRPPPPGMKMKNYLQKIVPWQPSNGSCSVSTCSTKFSKFGLFGTSKEHHCRLCGCTICDDCSASLKETEAVRVAKVCLQYDGGDGNPDVDHRVCFQCHVMLTKKAIDMQTKLTFKGKRRRKEGKEKASLTRPL